jgi:hypothetical protein
VSHKDKNTKWHYSQSIPLFSFSLHILIFFEKEDCEEKKAPQQFITNLKPYVQA